MLLVRKGLNKFYDIKVEFINQHRYNKDIIPKQGPESHNRAMRDYTLGAIYEFLEKGNGEVTILKTLKANGENC
jgi:hypothetical protein